MTLKQALKKAGKNGRVSSKSLTTFSQNKDSLVYWLVEDPHSSDMHKQSCLAHMLEAKDWQVDKAREVE